MKKKINLGKIEEGIYYKNVKFSNAVLWKDRELSLPPKVIQAITNQDVKRMIFTDYSKMERWIFDTKHVLANMKLKKVGQEEQYYFSIDLANKQQLEIKK